METETTQTEQVPTKTFKELVLDPWLNATADFFRDNDERTLLQTLAREELAEAVEFSQKLTTQHIIRIENVLKSYLLAFRADLRAFHENPDYVAPDAAPNSGVRKQNRDKTAENADSNPAEQTESPRPRATRARFPEADAAAKTHDRLRKALKELDAMYPKQIADKRKKRPTVTQMLQPILEKSKGAMEEILRREALETEPRTEETRRIEQEELNRMLQRELAREAAEGW